MHGDRYPLVLANGKRVAGEIRRELLMSGLTLDDFLAREAGWYERNIRHADPALASSTLLDGAALWPDAPS